MDLNLTVSEGILIAFIGVLGVVVGSAITFLTQWSLSSKQARLRILEKLYDKRVDAHEVLLEIPKRLRVTISDDEPDNSHDVPAYPRILSNKREFKDFHLTFLSMVNSNQHWFDISLQRELYYVQDYIYNISQLVGEKDDDKLRRIGLIIKPDFIKLAEDLESTILQFFEKDIHDMSIKPRRGRHKYPRDLATKRLNESELFKRWDELWSIQ
jgi:hypothetical protein